jgi:Flp pilus assembly secretin CpaC
MGRGRSLLAGVLAVAILSPAVSLAEGGARPGSPNPAPQGAKDPIVVTMDRAKVMRIPAPADTVIVGNPAIADVSVRDRQTLVLTGRMAGTTNVVVLDKKGDPIADEVVVVEVAETGIVFVQRGASRYSYACTPNCAVTLRTGDNKQHFDDAKNQIDSVNQNAASFTGSAQ